MGSIEGEEILQCSDSRDQGGQPTTEDRMMKGYPRLGEYRQLSKRTGSVCALCSEQATFRQFIEYPYMRGDDEAVKVCREHKKARYLSELTERITQ